MEPREELSRLIASNGYSETEAMNLLQDHGVISDLCVSIKDIANADMANAVAWFKRKGQPGSSEQIALF